MAGPSGRYRDALRQRDFRLLMVAYVVDALGGWAYVVVLAVYVFGRTHSTEWLAAVGASRWIAGLLVASVAGVIADRYERTRVMVASALCAAVVMSGMAIAVSMNAPLALLIALSVLATAAAAPYRPAAGALTPEVVGEKDLTAANSLFSTLESLVVVLGPAVGGLLLLTHRPVFGVIADAATYAAAAAIVARLRVRATGGGEGDGNAFGQWLVGLQALGAQRVALILVLFCALDSAIYGASTVLYIPLSIHLGTGSNGYSYLLAGQALGGVLAAGLANRLSRSAKLAVVIIGSIIVQAVPFAVTTLVHSPVPAFILQVISGVGMIVVDVLAYTALQRDLAREVLSRVLGVFDAIVLGFTVAASFIGAELLSSGSLDRTLLIIGFGFPAVSLIGLPSLLKADRASVATVERLAPTVELLGALDLFAGATHTMLERLAAHAEERRLPADSVLIRQGDEADYLWILVQGRLAIAATVLDGAEIDLPMVQAPGYVGELGLLHSAPRSATVTTVGECTVLRIDGAEFVTAIEASATSVSLQTTIVARLARTPDLGDPAPTLATPAG